MKALVHVVALDRRREKPLEIHIEEIDISTDAALLEQYGLEIPVLMIDGKKVAKYRITERELRRAILGRE
jgi:hypothetical protein